MRVSVKVDLLVGSCDDQVYGIINGSVDVNARRDQEAGVPSYRKWSVCIAKMPTLRSWSKISFAISFATVENNVPADAKNSKDTVMSEVDQELEWIESWGRRMCRESGRKAQRKKTGPRAQRDVQSARCGNLLWDPLKDYLRRRVQSHLQKTIQPPIQVNRYLMNVCSKVQDFKEPALRKRQRSHLTRQKTCDKFAQFVTPVTMWSHKFRKKILLFGRFRCTL
ncbi:hypothetical protein ALC56_05173 [Trachymyrmex septentrionalis]|uniref:Uncharacterized protein n=1 Tax=Trachymyrmex septentrionalis TaxID=34720 RepID=A0A195FIK2_9HYME|nr:hypothetical protein ALC56_05173 [Trachymyrmex septentrionalis]